MRASTIALSGTTLPALASPAAPSIAVIPTIRTFDYNQIELLDGPMRQQFDTNHAFFLRMDEDKALKPFRQSAYMAALGDDMGGWYDIDPAFNGKGSFHGFIPGHSFGQYTSGLARAYAVTGSKATQEKVQRLVAGFAPTVTSAFYDDYHLPAYTYDKTSIGLIDEHRKVYHHDKWPCCSGTVPQITADYGISS